MHYKLDLSSSILFHENRIKNKVFLEYLLEEDEQVTKDKLINHLLVFDEIQAIIKLHEYKKDFTNINPVQQDIILSQLEPYKIKSNNKEIEEIIDELIEAFSDEYKDDRILSLLRINYTYLCNKDNIYINEVKNLIRLKQENPFIQISLSKEGSHYLKGRVLVENEILYILNHEIGHLFFSYLGEYKIPYELDKTVMQLEYSNEFMKEKIISFDKLANEIAKDVYNEASIIIDKIYDGKNDEYKDEIEEYLQIANIPEWILSKINKDILTDEYIEKDKKIKKQMLTNTIMRTKYSNICIISDILDSITSGEYGSFMLKDKDGNKLNCLFGHGAAYYRNDKYIIFNEMIANYSALKKLDNSEESIILLQQLTSSDFVNMLENYYKEYVLSEENQRRR